MRSAAHPLRHAQTFMLQNLRRAAHSFMGGPLRQASLRRSLLRAVADPSRPLRVVIGGGFKLAPRGWHLTDEQILDITRPDAWKALFGERSLDALLAEHVWEHLPPDLGLEAARQCRRFLKKGGTLRIAVPDGLHPHDAYRQHVRPGGVGPGAADHKVLLTHVSLSALLEEAGFVAVPLEYWDEEGRFHHESWTAAEGGAIRRRPRFPPEAGRFVRGPEYAQFNDESITPKRRLTSAVWPYNYTSLIVDARKEA